MTNKEFVAKALDIATHYKTLYVNGTWGWPLTEVNKDRVLKNPKNQGVTRRTKIMSATPDTFGFDCIGLWKGILWGWNGNRNASYGGAGYAPVNGVPDLNETSFFNAGNDISEDFSQIVLGAMVWRVGHIGVYIGDGLVVEATPSWADGVQITTLDQRKTAEGYKYRQWTKWGKCLYLEYTNLMTYEQFCEYMKRYEDELNHKPVDAYAEDAMTWAMNQGIIQGSGSGNPMPQAPDHAEELLKCMASTVDENDTYTIASKNYVADYVSNYSSTHPATTATTATLTTNGWSNNAQTITVTGVTSTNSIIVSPDPSSTDYYVASGVLCTAQSTNSLTFTCTSVPTNTITVNVLIFN